MVWWFVQCFCDSCGSSLVLLSSFCSGVDDACVVLCWLAMSKAIWSLCRGSNLISLWVKKESPTRTKLLLTPVLEEIGCFRMF